MTRHQGNTMDTGSSASSGRSGRGTGTDDVTYDVLSVVYHALQGADTIGKYLQDARSDHPDVERFLREAREQNTQLAQRGRECLRQLLSDERGAAGQQMQGGSSKQMGSSGGDSRQPK